MRPSRHARLFVLGILVLCFFGPGLAVAASGEPTRDRALVAAVENGDLEAVEDALAAGADPDARRTGDSLRPTALMLAAGADRFDLATVLLKAGADPEAVDAAGTTAVMWAVTRRANYTLKVLVDAGADVRRDQGNRTPLLAALAERNEDAVPILIAGGADVGAQGNAGQPPLILAADRGYPWAVRWLLEAGATVDARGVEGHTALDAAVERGHAEIAKLLRARGGRRSSELEPRAPAAIETSAELTPDALSWAFLVLQRMGEPGLCQDSDLPAASGSGESFRFLWIRTFHEPVMVRIEGRADGSAVLTAAVLDGQGGYEFGMPGHRVTRSVKPRHWRQLHERAAAASFWRLPAAVEAADRVVLDGASWILEGRRDGACHAVWRVSPEAGGPWSDFRRLCRTLLDLAELGAEARPVY